MSGKRDFKKKAVCAHKRYRCNRSPISDKSPFCLAHVLPDKNSGYKQEDDMQCTNAVQANGTKQVRLRNKNFEQITEEKESNEAKEPLSLASKEKTIDMVDFSKDDSVSYEETGSIADSAEQPHVFDAEVFAEPEGISQEVSVDSSSSSELESEEEKRDYLKYAGTYTELEILERQIAELKKVKELNLQNLGIASAIMNQNHTETAAISEESEEETTDSQQSAAVGSGKLKRKHPKIAPESGLCGYPTTAGTCKRVRIPLGAEYCAHHIHLSEKQFLFSNCEDGKAGWNCNQSILCRGNFCANKVEVPESSESEDEEDEEEQFFFPHGKTK